jgi:hypothetical protein
MRKFPVLSCLLLLLIGFSSCKKTYDHYTISDDFRSWLDYNRGSYWIYKNENSGKNDSTSVWDRNYETSDAQKGNGYYFDYIDTKLKGGFIQEIYMQGNSDYQGGLITTNFSSYPEAFRTNAAVNQNIIWNGGKYVELAPNDTLVLNNRNFYSVRHTKTADTVKGDSIVREYYFARNIGLIKFRQQYKSTDSVWTLLRWNVTQN